MKKPEFEKSPMDWMINRSVALAVVVGLLLAVTYVGINESVTAAKRAEELRQEIAWQERYERLTFDTSTGTMLIGESISTDSSNIIIGTGASAVMVGGDAVPTDPCPCR